MKKYVIYVLRSLKDGKLYIGHTDSLHMRLIRHHSGDVRSTKARRPLKLVYSESVQTREKAVSRERYFKSGPGHRFLQSKLIANKNEKGNT
ncbi:GIY-YIG nuclease family protein [candidate division TA06 bacterium]|uniref:GIY-YIG nuclease family protein n=1 Tax=candidate division TA06 bacterium TaxID=2250710 RepID=A0A523XIK9_UNCT6|nr:MAG: GIY-YIG nuclease family protein [candidate division TA06 bacterium]